MAEEPDESDRFIEEFHKFLSRVDAVAQTVLNGHLDIERHLDDVLKVILFHPEHVQEGRITFFQKIQIARGFSIRGNNDVQWRLIEGFNRLRNEIAHGGDSLKRRDRIGSLRKMMNEIGTPKFRKEIAESDEKQVVVRATAMCGGFLLNFKNDLIALRQRIDHWDEELNPEEPRVTMPPHLIDDD